MELYKQKLLECKSRLIRRGDVYKCKLGKTYGSEQGGDRYALVIQNDIGNKHSPTVIVAFITSKVGKKKLPTHFEITLEEPSLVLSEQIRTIDKRRLKEYVTTLSEEEMECINECLRVSLDL